MEERTSTGCKNTIDLKRTRMYLYNHNIFVTRNTIIFLRLASKVSINKIIVIK